MEESTEKLYTIPELQKMIAEKTGYRVSLDILKARIREGVIPAVNTATPWESKAKMRIRESDLPGILGRYPVFTQPTLFTKKGE